MCRMVDRVKYDCGIGSIGDRSDTGEFREEESSKKRRRSDFSPHSKNKSASLLPEESSESTVKKSLKQVGYSDPEDMPKYRTKFTPTSPSKGEANDAEASKN